MSYEATKWGRQPVCRGLWLVQGDERFGGRAGKFGLSCFSTGPGPRILLHERMGCLAHSHRLVVSCPGATHHIHPPLLSHLIHLFAFSISHLIDSTGSRRRLLNRPNVFKSRLPIAAKFYIIDFNTVEKSDFFDEKKRRSINASMFYGWVQIHHA